MQAAVPPSQELGVVMMISDDDDDDLQMLECQCSPVTRAWGGDDISSNVEILALFVIVMMVFTTSILRIL